MMSVSGSGGEPGPSSCTEDFAVHHLRNSVAHVLENMGFSSTADTALDILVDASKRFMVKTCTHAKFYSQHAGRTQLDVDDLTLAFRRMQFSSVELYEYLQQVARNIPSTSKPVPKFPAPKTHRAIFAPAPSAKELETRHEHIPSHYQAAIPAWTREGADYLAVMKPQTADKKTPAFPDFTAMNAVALGLARRERPAPAAPLTLDTSSATGIRSSANIASVRVVEPREETPKKVKKFHPRKPRKPGEFSPNHAVSPQSTSIRPLTPAIAIATPERICAPEPLSPMPILQTFDRFSPEVEARLPASPPKNPVIENIVLQNCEDSMSSPPYIADEKLHESVVEYDRNHTPSTPSKDKDTAIPTPPNVDVNVKPRIKNEKRKEHRLDKVKHDKAKEISDRQKSKEKKKTKSMELAIERQKQMLELIARNKQQQDEQKQTEKDKEENKPNDRDAEEHRTKQRDAAEKKAREETRKEHREEDRHRRKEEERIRREKEEEIRRKEEEIARKEEEKKRKEDERVRREEEKRRKEEEKQRKEEEKQRKEEERLRKEEERQRKEEEKARKEQERQRKEEERVRKEEEKKRKEEEIVRKEEERQKKEEETKRKLEEEEKARKRDAEKKEAIRLQQETLRAATPREGTSKDEDEDTVPFYERSLEPTTNDAVALNEDHPNSLVHKKKKKKKDKHRERDKDNDKHKKVDRTEEPKKKHHKHDKVRDRTPERKDKGGINPSGKEKGRSSDGKSRKRKHAEDTPQPTTSNVTSPETPRLTLKIKLGSETPDAPRPEPVAQEPLKLKFNLGPSPRKEEEARKLPPLKLEMSSTSQTPVDSGEPPRKKFYTKAELKMIPPKLSEEEIRRKEKEEKKKRKEEKRKREEEKKKKEEDKRKREEEKAKEEENKRKKEKEAVDEARKQEENRRKEEERKKEEERREKEEKKREEEARRKEKEEERRRAEERRRDDERRKDEDRKKEKKAKKKVHDDDTVWICPCCSVAWTDGANMVGCDDCDNWFHWHCVGLLVAPAAEVSWYCQKCSGRRKRLGPSPKKRKH